MANWFPRSDPTKHHTERLEDRIRQLENLLKKMSTPVEHHYHIEKIELHQPSIEQLSFNLESIDIEELSGALNLGNNFGVSVAKKEHATDENGTTGKMKKHESGYSFSFARNEKGE